MVLVVSSPDSAPPDPLVPEGSSDAEPAADDVVLEPVVLFDGVLLVVVFLAVVAFFVAVFLAGVVFFAAVFLAGAAFLVAASVVVDVSDDAAEPVAAEPDVLAVAPAGSAVGLVAVDVGVPFSSDGFSLPASCSGTSGTQGSAGGS